MPDDQESGTGVADEGAGTGTAGGSGSQTTETETQTFDAAYVKKLREEAAAHRVREKEATLAAKELAARVKELESQGLSESEKQAKRIKELEDEHRNIAWKARSAEIKSQAAALGCKKPDLIARLVDDDVDDDDLPKAVAKLKKEHPELFLSTTGSADGGAGGGSGSGAGGSPGLSMNALIRGASGRG